MTNEKAEEISDLISKIMLIHDAICQIKQQLDPNSEEDMEAFNKLKTMDLYLQIYKAYLEGDFMTYYTLRMLVVCEHKTNYMYKWISKFISEYKWIFGKYYYTWDFYCEYRRYLMKNLPNEEYPKDIYPKLHLKSASDFVDYYLSFACILRRVFDISKYHFRRGRHTHVDGRFRRGYYMYPYQKLIAGRYKNDEERDMSNFYATEEMQDYINYLLEEEIPDIMKDLYPETES
jgi:hypothetical protein